MTSEYPRRPRGGGVAEEDAAPRPVDASPPGPGESWTVLRLIRWSGDYLEDKGIESGRLDAEHLLARALDTERLQLYLEFDRPLSREERDAFRPLLLRRAEREPLQHILGRTGFRELELVTDRRALIPRPETEELVQAVLEWAREDAGSGEGLTALDVGTGSGAIALSLALEGPFRGVVATERSEEALELARENAARAGLEEGVTLRRGDLFEPAADEAPFDVVVSNPPYVARGEVAELPAEVRDWEPRQALVAGPEGTEVIRRLVEGAPPLLRSGGLLALEIGAGQWEEVRRIVEGEGSYRDCEIRRDLAGRERILLALRR